MSVEAIWMAISPGARSTRLIAMRGPNETILKAQLCLEPSSMHALRMLLEAIAMWEGIPVRAVLVVDDHLEISGNHLYAEPFPPLDRTALYSIVRVRRHHERRGLEDIRGMGDFRDLRQLVLSEVAR
jgi:hypothetical protein